ncbi:MAG TPA: hypothetical protein VLL96_03235 [Candidatus Deferrimicrobiaceae bacterium]|nr:hypothetical protein [Candidatus Deferrimicrobiaceae bacterium]
MKGKTIGLIIGVLLLFVVISCILSELDWLNKESTPDQIREIVGLPSIAVGNLNPAARNPGLEILCTGLFDSPGGYCSYYTNGVPFIQFAIGGNITVSEAK